MKLELTYKDSNGNSSAPLLKQRLMSEKQKKYNLFWGSRGPGKTDWLVFEGIANAVEVPNNYVLFGRFDLDELRKTILPRIDVLLPKELIVNHNQQEREIKLINGSIIAYMFLDESKRVLPKLLSMNTGAICIDQIEEITERVFLGLKGTLRRPGTRQAIYSTANPVKNWIYRRWMLRAVDEGENPDDYFQMGGYSEENPYLDEAYINILKSYPKAWRKRFYEASWEEPGGLVYPFNDSYVIDKKDVIIPNSADLYELVDYGVRVTVFLWAAKMSDGHIVIYKELWSENETADHNAEIVKLMRGKDKIIASFTCPSAFKVESDKRNAAERYADHGIFLYNAYIHWQPRFEIVSSLFQNNMIQISSACPHLIEQLNTYSWPDVPVESSKAEQPAESKMHSVEAFERGLAYLEKGKIPPVENFLRREEIDYQWQKDYELTSPDVIWAEKTNKPKVMELY